MKSKSIILIVFLSLPFSFSETLEEGTKVLLDCSKAGNSALVKRVLQTGVDINSKGSYGETALHLSSRAGHLAVVQLLVSKGASVDVRDRLGQTPCMLASERGKSKIVDYLLKKGGKANAVDGNGTTALMWACISKDKETIKSLLRHKANINATDKRGRTALDFVRYNVELQTTLKLLLEMGGEKGSHTRKSGDLSTLKKRQRQRDLKRMNAGYSMYQSIPIKNSQARQAFLLGFVLKLEGKTEAAGKSFADADKLEKGGCLPCLLPLAEINSQNRLYEEADLTVEKLINSEMPKSRITQLMYTMGITAFQNEDYDFASRYFSSTLERTEEKTEGLYPDVYYYLGCLEDENDNLDLARTHLNNYISAHPDSAFYQEAQARLAELKPSILPIRSFDGQRMDMDHFEGDWILYDFWSANRDYEKKTFGFLKKLAKSLSGKSFTIISINVDEDNQNAQDMITNLNPAWPQFSDPRLRFFRAKYQISEIPSYCLVKPDGTIIDRISSKDIKNYKVLVKRVKKAMRK